jgi:hypothetical protein
LGDGIIISFVQVPAANGDDQAFLGADSPTYD